MKTTIWVFLTMAVAAATASEAEPPTCKAACQRLTDCNMSSYTNMCLDSCKQQGYEGTEAGRAQLLTLTRYSCQQIQSAMAGTDAHNQRPSTRTTPARTPSTRAPSPDEVELDKLDKELDDFDKQLGNDSAELERRSRGGPKPARGGSAPVRGAKAPARDARVLASRGRPSSPGSHWTCKAEGLSVYGFDVESGGGGDIRGRSTVSIPANGSSKDEAARKSLSACGSLMTTNLSTDRSMVLDGSSEGQWGVRIEVACHVTQCAPI
jgi:hypothetical protein